MHLLSTESIEIVCDTSSRAIIMVAGPRNVFLSSSSFSSVRNVLLLELVILPFPWVPGSGPEGGSCLPPGVPASLLVVAESKSFAFVPSTNVSDGRSHSTSLQG